MNFYEWPDALIHTAMDHTQVDPYDKDVKFAEAERNYCKCLFVFENKYGDEHPTLVFDRAVNEIMELEDAFAFCRALYDYFKRAICTYEPELEKMGELIDTDDYKKKTAVYEKAAKESMRILYGHEKKVFEEMYKNAFIMRRRSIFMMYKSMVVGISDLENRYGKAKM